MEQCTQSDANAQIRAEVQQLRDRYDAIMDLVAAATDPTLATQLRHEAKKTWREWLAKSEVLITRDAHERRLGGE